MGASVQQRWLLIHFVCLPISICGQNDVLKNYTLNPSRDWMDFEKRASFRECEALPIMSPFFMLLNLRGAFLFILCHYNIRSYTKGICTVEHIHRHTYHISVLAWCRPPFSFHSSSTYSHPARRRGYSMHAVYLSGPAICGIRLAFRTLPSAGDEKAATIARTPCPSTFAHTCHRTRVRVTATAATHNNTAQNALCWRHATTRKSGRGCAGVVAPYTRYTMGDSVRLGRVSRHRHLFNSTQHSRDAITIICPSPSLAADTESRAQTRRPHVEESRGSWRYHSATLFRFPYLSVFPSTYF